MIEPLTSLAFSVYSGKGVYALLLGSGLSRAAQIPTGWEVTLDLVRKIAAVEDNNCQPSPEEWYLKKFGREPDYSLLLESLTLTPTERTNALCSYFEATPEERTAGKKVPTSAHRAIAQLVAKGYFRIIITTNFDRLMEQALETAGISPTVISTPDMAHGAIPLTHSNCTVIKVNGDYRDTRLRNTSQELSAYDTEFNKLLDRVFDEYGLIVCGWSATWDEALRAAILRCPNRRYSVTWTFKETPSQEADALVQFRQALLLPIESADQFFTTLTEKLDALERFNSPHPLSAAVAVASLKKFLVEDRFRIELNDLLMEEVERQIKMLSTLPVQTRANFSCDELSERLEVYESSVGILLALVVNGCYWGRPAQAALWARTIERMLDLSPPQSGTPLLLSLRRYPACILLYAGGVASTASGAYETLKVLLRDQRTSIDAPIDGKDDLLIGKIAAQIVLDGEALNKCSKGKRFRMPSSERLYTLLREPLRPFLPNDARYDDAFDRFEYLLALVYYEYGGHQWAPIGRFGWRHRSFGSSGTHVSQVLLDEHESKGPAWELIEAGIFPSSEKFLTLEKSFRENVLSLVRTF